MSGPSFFYMPQWPRVAISSAALGIVIIRIALAISFIVMLIMITTVVLMTAALHDS